MAVNKHNSNVNGGTPKHLEELEAERSRRLAEINASRGGKQEDISKAIGDLNSMFHNTGDSGKRDEILESIKESSLLRGFVNAEAENSIDKQNRIISERITTHTKARNVNERTTTMSSEARFFKEARQSSNLSIPTEVLEQNISSGIERTTSLGQQLAEEMRKSGGGGLSANYKSIANKLQESEEGVALLKREKQHQSRMGLSTEKIYNNFEDTTTSASKALDVIGNRGIIDAAKNGKFGSLEQETEKLKTILKNVGSTFEEYQAASEKYAAEQTETNKKILDASLDKLKAEEKGAEEQARVVRATDMYGAAGGGGWNRVANGVPIVSKAVDSISGMMIDDNISNMRLRAATGQTAVDQYNRVGAAMGGDMRSLLAESSSAEFIKNFSDKMRGRKVVAEVANIAVDSTGVVANGVINTAKAGGNWQAGVASVAGDAMGVVRRGSQLNDGIHQTTTALEAEAAARQAAMVGNEMKAKMLQSVYNQSQSAYSATIGGGSSGAESTLLDTFYLNNMANQGMKAGDAAQLTGSAIAAMGSGAATSTALKAAKAQATGIMSAEQFIGMSGQMSSIGGGADNLETIMKNAVAGGFDNAKNVQQMVSATVSLSSNMAKMGYSGAAGSGRLVAGLTQDLVVGGMDKNLAGVAAQSQLELRSSMDKSTGMDIGSIYKFAELKKAFPNASTMQLQGMSTLDQQTLESMRTDPTMAGKMGLPDITGEAATKVGAINTKGTMMNVGFGITAQSENDKKVAMMLAGLSAGSDQNRVGKNPNEGVLSEKQSAAFQMRKQDATFDLKQFSAGAALGGEGGVMTVLSDIKSIMETLSNNMSPEKAQKNVETSMDSMKVVGPVLSAAGKDLKDGSAAFVSAVNKFNQVLTAGGINKDKVNTAEQISEDTREGVRKGGGKLFK